MLRNTQKQAEADDDAGHSGRQPGEKIEHAAPDIARAHDEIGDRRKEQHRDERRPCRHHHRVPKRAGWRNSGSCSTVAQCARVNVPLGHVEIAEDLHEAAQEHERDRQQGHGRQQQQNERAERPTPAPEIGAAQREFPGDGRARAPPRDRLLGDDERHHQRDAGDAERRRPCAVGRRRIEHDADRSRC